MKRRGFIKTGMVTMAAGSSSNAALGEIIIPISENISQVEMENFISELDLRMDLISSSGGNYLKDLLNQTPTKTQDDYFRSSLRTLLLIGNFGDLPIKGQVHPQMQKRLHYSSPEISHSVTKSIDILKNMSDESMEDIRSALSDDPDLGDRIMEALDLEAQSIGIPAARRRQMRIMGKRINRRLKHSPDMLINEYVKKADKLMQSSNSDEDLEKLLRTQEGEDNYSASRKEAEAASIQWSRWDLPEIPIDYSPIITEQDDNKLSKEEIDVKKRRALRLLGVGGVTTAIGWIIIAISGGMAGVIMGITLGPLLILIALILLIVVASESGKSKE
jgi:hypothetical protein